MAKRHIKSLFVSDIHIGTKHNNAKKLLRVLESYEFENLFLVGDIIDLTALNKKPRWKKSYGKLLRLIIELSRKTNIIYVTGNHDFYLREWTPFTTEIGFVCDEYQYGDRLIIHGDKFDTLIYKKRWLYGLGSWAYETIITLDRLFHFDGGLSRRGKKMVKKAVNYLNDFYETARVYTKRRQCTTVICGHTHMQEYRQLDGVEYYNCGDFREGCDYLIEELDGSLHLIDGHGCTGSSSCEN
jgi:UDP-2,3-diacylglucosamine pyrophosphatase LpxH